MAQDICVARPRRLVLSIFQHDDVERIFLEHLLFLRTQVVEGKVFDVLITNIAYALVPIVLVIVFLWVLFLFGAR